MDHLPSLLGIMIQLRHCGGMVDAPGLGPGGL